MKKFIVKIGLMVGVLAIVALPAAAQIPEAASMQGITNLPMGEIMTVASNIMQWLLMLVGFLAVISFVISGILYLTAGGDEDQIAKARRAFMGAVMGVIVSLLGLIVLGGVQDILSGTGEFSF